MWRLAVLCLTCLPIAALGGAWPREQGSGFLSASTTVRTDRGAMGAFPPPLESYGALYLEYGLTPKITVGLDAGYGNDGSYSALAFARLPVGAGRNGHVFAVKAGAGATRMGGVTQPLVMIGADWGRGFETGLGGGWLSLETGLHYFVQKRETAAKADLTLGLKPWDSIKLMLQVQAGKYPGSDPYLRLAPSVAREIRKGMHAEIGIEAGVTGDDRIGLKLGTWLEF